MNDIQRQDAISLAEAAVEAARHYVRTAQRLCHAAVAIDGRVDPERVEAAQRQVHGFAWVATGVEGPGTIGELGAAPGRCRAVRRWRAVGGADRLRRVSGPGAGRPADEPERDRPPVPTCRPRRRPTRCGQDPAVRWYLREGNTPAARAELCGLLADGWRPDDSLGDETLDMVRDQFRQFADERIAPHAHGWHLADALIPDAVVASMAEAGRVRGLHRRSPWRPGVGQAGHVRGVGGAEPRLDRRRVAWHPVGDRR